MWIGLTVLALVALMVASSGGLLSPRNRRREEADALLLRAAIAPVAEQAVLYSRALQLARESGDGLFCTEAAYGLGEVAMKQKNFQSAESYFSLALTFKDRAGEPILNAHPNYDALIRRRLAEAKAGKDSPSS